MASSRKSANGHQTTSSRLRDMLLENQMQLDSDLSRSMALFQEHGKIMQSRHEAHHRVVCAAASAAVDILDRHGFRCAISGGFACKVYGNDRYPEDVDIFVFPKTSTLHVTSEQLKDILVSSNPSFYLRNSVNPLATYRVLWYRSLMRSERSKVDLLVPGASYHLPILSTASICTVDAMPLVPFCTLLLHKLQAWDDHVQAVEIFYQQRQHKDAKDVINLLKLPHAVALRAQQPWNDEKLFDKNFQRISKERVRRFCLAFPESVKDWKLLGFGTK